MSTTLGQVRERLLKLPHGAGTDLIVLSGMINDRYQQFLNAYQWSRLVVTDEIQTTAKYDTGTIAVTEGGTTLTGTDTVWTSAMTGRRIRIGGHNASYVFTYVSSTSATIDRAYEDDTETVGTYAIYQSVYATPLDVDYIDSIEVPGGGYDLDQKSAEYLDRLATGRWTVGRPTLYAPAADVTVNSVIYPAIEFYPAPDTSEGVIIRYHKIVSALSASSDEFLPWVAIECIFAGCEADLFVIKGNMAGYQVRELRFQTLLKDAIHQDSDRQYPESLIMDDRFTWHRTARALGHDTINRHFFQLRNSN